LGRFVHGKYQLLIWTIFCPVGKVFFFFFGLDLKEIGEREREKD
jgi:hypothetical protein